MAITVHSIPEVEAMRRAGAVAAQTLHAVCRRVAAGISTADIDAWVREDTARRGATPSQLGFRGFPAAVCTSVGSVVCHGIPSRDVVLRDGDTINVDVTSCFEGFHGDTSRSLLIGTVDADTRRVTEAAKAAMWAGIEAVRPGARLGDVGAAIAECAATFDCTVVREFGGHGIGRRMHMPPHIEHVGRRGSGRRLKTGMTFTIEPMVNAGDFKTEILSDHWTVLTRDRRLSAQFEHTMCVTREGVEVLTARPRLLKNSEDKEWSKLGPLTVPASVSASRSAAAEA